MLGREKNNFLSSYPIFLKDYILLWVADGRRTGGMVAIYSGKTYR